LRACGVPRLTIYIQRSGIQSCSSTTLTGGNVSSFRGSPCIHVNPAFHVWLSDLAPPALAVGLGAARPGTNVLPTLLDSSTRAAEPRFTIASMSSEHESWMRRAIEQAKAAQLVGEVPVGAIIVRSDELIAAGENRNLRDHDPSAHAEIVALRAAGTALGNHRLDGCEMYVIIEPCAMCAGALVHARLKALIYGASDPKAGAVSSVMNVLNHPRLNHRMEVIGGVLEAECSELLKSFFRSRRVEAE